MADINDKKVEELLGDIDDILKEMDEEDVSLEDSFKLYNEGLALLKTCYDKIEKVEKDIEVLENE